MNDDTVPYFWLITIASIVASYFVIGIYAGLVITIIAGLSFILGVAGIMKYSLDVLGIDLYEEIRQQRNEND